MEDETESDKNLKVLVDRSIKSAFIRQNWSYEELCIKTHDGKWLSITPFTDTDGTQRIRVIKIKRGKEDEQEH